MPRLIVRSAAVPESEYELKLGINRLGRSSQADFQIEHPTISAIHCELILTDGGVKVRDTGSTNGTFIQGQRVQEGVLTSGDVLQVGSVEVLLDNAEIKIAIPIIPVPVVSAPEKLADGSIACRRHPGLAATYRCTHCKELLCDNCLHHVRRVGGVVLLLCPLCSHRCESLVAPGKKRRPFIEFLRKTLKIREKAPPSSLPD